LPITRAMRWGASHIKFIRPVHWLIMMLDSTIINTQILGLQSGNKTRGHRFHHPHEIIISNPYDYDNALKTGCVLANFDERRVKIRDQINHQAAMLNLKTDIDESLLEEVTALVEWPSALTGSFDESFLSLPDEVLISSMKAHQKYFHIVDDDNKLCPYFITVSNVFCDDPSKIILGNEKVLYPRLADAQFFYEADIKTTMEARCEQLKTIVFQRDLGSIYSKVERIASIATYVAQKVGGNSSWVKRASKLCKSDLTSKMVFEFPDLQGVMGSYYAQNDREHSEVCLAIKEHYNPKFADDDIPNGITGCIVSIADKIDTLTGMFGINKKPSGSKDPFALRRAILGVLSIIRIKEFDVDMDELLRFAIGCFSAQGVTFVEAKSVQATQESDALNTTLTGEILEFVFDRLKIWYSDNGVSIEVFQSVRAINVYRPLDFDKRIRAMQNFISMPEASDLSTANKRVANILSGFNKDLPSSIDETLLVEPSEQRLKDIVVKTQMQIQPMLKNNNYIDIMKTLAHFKNPLESFFDNVLVNTDDEPTRLNRYLLLRQVRHLFLEVADISLL